MTINRVEGDHPRKNRAILFVRSEVSLSKLFYTVDNIFCINNNKSAVKRIIVILLRIEFVYKTYKHPTNATYILSRDLERN